MLKEVPYDWVCDCCPKEERTEDGEIPIGWWEMGINLIPGNQMPPQEYEWELCSDACKNRSIDEATKLINEVWKNSGDAFGMVLIMKKRDHTGILPEAQKEQLPVDEKATPDDKCEPQQKPL